MTVTELGQNGLVCLGVVAVLLLLVLLIVAAITHSTLAVGGLAGLDDRPGGLAA